MSSKYFYIVQFDGGVTEIPYAEERHKAAMNALHQGGVVGLEDANGEPLVFNAGTISKILTENQYDGHLDTTKPKKYILRGSWYDNKGNHTRNEPWKQKLVDQKKQLLIENQEEANTPEAIKARKEIAKKMREAWGNKNKND